MKEITYPSWWINMRDSVYDREYMLSVRRSILLAKKNDDESELDRFSRIRRETEEHSRNAGLAIGRADEAHAALMIKLPQMFENYKDRKGLTFLSNVKGEEKLVQPIIFFPYLWALQQWHYIADIEPPNEEDKKKAYILKKSAVNLSHRRQIAEIFNKIDNLILD